jgi:hypothetical protein
MKDTLEDYRRHQKAREQTGGRDAARWGRSASPLCRSAPYEGIFYELLEYSSNAS